MRRKVFPVVLIGVVFLLFSASAMAVELGEPGESIVSGDPSKVGPPWNWRPTISFPSLKTHMAIGGYVKFDALYDLDYDLGDVTNPAAIGMDETDGRVRFVASETRLNVRTETETEIGRVYTYVEGHFLQPDFVDQQGNTFGGGAFGLRHAYGVINGFLFGQTWSNYMSFIGSPDILKLGAPHGHPFRRHAQVRYTKKLGKSNLSFALEEPNTIVAAASPTGGGETPMPDVTARYEYGHMLAVAAVGRFLKTQESASGAGDDDSVFGYSIQVHFSYPVLSSTTIKAAGSYGQGVGYYLGPPVASPANYPDVYVEDGDLKAVELTMWSLGLVQRWTPKWYSNFSYTVTNQDIPDSVGPPTIAFPETITFGTANLIFNATSRLAFGVEYQLSTRKDNRATSGSGGDVLDETANRIQASAVFQF